MAIKSEKEISSGIGVWKNPEIYEKTSGLPVMSALRTVVSSYILDRMQSQGEQEVLSLGIGSGEMYKVFTDQIRSQSLKLKGMDILPGMVCTCVENLGGDVVTSFEEAVDSKSPLFVCQDLLLPFRISKGALDVVESNLVLHHVLERSQIVDVFRRIEHVLKPRGIFVLGDIDVFVGEYVDLKKIQLQQKYGDVEIDNSTAEFVYTVDGEENRLPILDMDNSDDRRVVDDLKRITCDPLLEEMQENNPLLENPIIENVGNALCGLEWHRSVNGDDGWISLIKEAFGPDCKITLINPEQIRKEYDGVLDNPFVLVVEKA